MEMGRQCEGQTWGGQQEFRLRHVFRSGTLSPLGGEVKSAGGQASLGVEGEEQAGHNAQCLHPLLGLPIPTCPPAGQSVPSSQTDFSEELKPSGG